MTYAPEIIDAIHERYGRAPVTFTLSDEGAYLQARARVRAWFQEQVTLRPARRLPLLEKTQEHRPKVNQPKPKPKPRVRFSITAAEITRRRAAGERVEDIARSVGCSTALLHKRTRNAELPGFPCSECGFPTLKQRPECICADCKRKHRREWQIEYRKKRKAEAA